MRGLFDHIGGGDGRALNGVESRALRALLCLDRRHISLLANVIGAGPSGGVDNKVVTQWERSAERGYPEILAQLLQDLGVAVDNLAHRLKVEAEEQAERGGDEPVATLRRPLGGRRIVQILGLGGAGIEFSPAQMERLDDQGSDFWQCLCDAAIARAAVELDNQEYAVRVMLDKEPEQ